MKSSDYIATFLRDQGIDTVFGYMGGMITHLADSLDKCQGIQFIQTYHEQTASMAAEGYAIGSDGIGCAISTSGPGATNMITGIADAYFDSVPVLYITGQVNSYEYKYDKPIRQQGFQETNVIDIVKSITKYAVLVDDAQNLRYELEKAIHIAKEGRKGPVLLDITMDVQRADITPDSMRRFVVPHITQDLQVSHMKDIKYLIEKSKSPMVLLGGGCQSRETSELLNEYFSANQVPVVTSLMGRGVIDETYKYYVGMVGSYGNRCANITISQADVLLVLGSRLDTRQTGAKIETFLKGGHIIHVDIDDNELKCHRIKNQLHINMLVLDFLRKLKSDNVQFNPSIEWLNYVRRIKNHYNQNEEITRFVQNKAPYHFIQSLNQILEEGDIVTTDVGQNQMWAAQTVKLKRRMKFVTSGGLAPMGYSMPVAIGLNFTDVRHRTYCLCGDGGFHISLQALGIIAQYHLPIKVIIMNNVSLGMITQFQHLYFKDNMVGTTKEGGYIVPSFKEMVKAYGIQYARMTKADLNDSLRFRKIIEGADVIEYLIEGLTTVSPKLEYNQPIENPIPFLPDDEKANIQFKA
ncbi:thiamine pyrophosphate-binding protein [Segatella maculosa]|uniref:thiamine pyrophosphate-binding protein n=1 Tax=Segatella maculosa TaxID=439703 RepID=UPI00035FCC5E|nr:thiamine pyrophosphate-binding protein [Segatella maculosa]